MKTHIIINDNVSISITPENEMEVEAFKILMKQNNEVIQIRETQYIFSKKIGIGSIIIQKEVNQNKLEEIPNDEKQQENM
jgi:hypothetical protein